MVGAGNQLSTFNFQQINFQLSTRSPFLALILALIFRHGSWKRRPVHFLCSIKKSIIMKHLFLFTLLFSLFSFTSMAQKVGDKGQVESSGMWYDATILKVNSAEGLFFIHYDGWADSWDEWVGKDRMRNFAKEAPAPAKPAATEKKWKVGDRVMVEYGMIPEPATVIEVGEEHYHIQYDKKVFGTKWVKEGQIKKL
jgi:hypothetical protein